MSLLELISPAPVTVMLGMCKNAGKTTALCRLIREYAERGGAPIALTSIGRDGESRDLVTGTDKPPIYLYEGMLAATAEQLLPLCDVSREILAATGLFTSLGEVVIFRAKSDGFVQLAGPGIVGQLKTLRGMLEGFGAQSVLIDGALSRKSPASCAADGACVLSTGASLHRDLDRVVTETAYAARLLSLPESAAPGPELDRVTLFRSDGSSEGAAEALALRRGAGESTLLFSGALTEAQAKALLQDGTDKRGLTLLVRDGSCLMLRRETFDSLASRGVRFAVQNDSRLAAVTVNAVSAGGWVFDAAELLEKMRAAVSAPVVDVMAE
ncbi:MAG: hypothetical protein E7425_00035 [Ruminococcaceae bacterium]|nr:hypothetical protein [Oscillospiraceae bacterium]